MTYCVSKERTIRFPTREVMVGNVGIGGHNPIRIQSMTTSNTRDVEATGRQIIRLKEAGCEIARVTVQGKKEAQALEGIKNFLVKVAVDIPLVADIHFYPPAALFAAEFADKVRINPGNFVDKRASFKRIEYDDATYAQELEKIEEAFAPLVEKCKRLKRAIRIGTNHGSLSDRIMNRFGDSPRGMVESALEFTRVCRKYDFHDIVFSMKASNPIVMVAAYRLLNAEQIRLGWNYPLHLGVTEAGEGEDGRIKSTLGIGALLIDGLGDTIRVSLTEDPWEEIEPCKKIIQCYENQLGKGRPFIPTQPSDLIQTTFDLSTLLIDRPDEALSFGLDDNILQAARIKMIKTDFISCPGCGRTLFDLQETTRKIREKTAHLPGVKIAIMGCIVNGPGEMADADFGYVGSKPKKIDLYVGKTCVERNIDSLIAVEKLIDLIKINGKWVEPLV